MLLGLDKYILFFNKNLLFNISPNKLKANIDIKYIAIPINTLFK